MFEESNRLRSLPTYVFDTTDKLKNEEYAKGKDLIDLSMASPDFPTARPVVEAMKAALDNPANHRYPSFDGLPEFRQTVAKWCHEQYKINIDPNKEVLPLIGSKEGLVHLAFAFIDSGDIALVPQPAYPAHFRGTMLCGGKPVIMPTSEKTGYIPDFSLIDDNTANKAKLMILSYPTNPTGGMATKEFFEKAVAFCKKHNIILIHDFAYAEIYFDGHKPPSIFEIPGAKDIAIEFHTFSKTFSMAGWRMGFVIGNPELVAIVRKMKTNLDYGLFAATQRAGIAAMNLPKEYFDEIRSKYQERRDAVVDGFNSLGWNIEKPKGSMYVWVEVPKGYNSTSFFMDLLKRAGVVVSPGVGFGELGEGYIRIALIDTVARIKEAISRIEKVGIKYGK